MSKISMGDILKGCEPKSLQSVGFMQVIPLVMSKDLWDDRFVSAAEGLVGTTHYGTLEIDNKTDKEMIVPAQAGYVVKQAAQDHALPHVGLVGKKKSVKFDTAMCIQQTQGGYVQKDQHDMLILPFMLRETAHSLRKGASSHSYDRLWPAISSMNQQLGIRNTAGHLEFFLQEFGKELDRFVAEFEIVPNQVGAIILINGRVAGVERAPNPEFWESIWQPLIRECYGSLAIMESRATGKKGPPKTRVAMREVDSLSDLKVALKEAEDQEWSMVGEVVDEILSDDLDLSNDDEKDGFSVDEAKSKRFIGQVVLDSERVVYASLVATADYRKNEIWRKQKAFTMAKSD